MKITVGIKSTVKPAEIDDTSSTTVVYVHSNINEIIEIDPVFNVETTVYEYDEIEYTLAEWTGICNELLYKELNKTNFAIVELLDLLDLILVTSDNESNKSPYINILYGDMIKKNLITIDRVPERFKAGVELYLQD